MKILKYVLIVALVLILGFFILKNKTMAPSEDLADNTSKVVDLCFAKTITSDSGLEDKYSLVFKIQGDKVAGNLSLIPAEKDSKVGSFEGVVTDVDKKSMSRTALLWWDTQAEGTNILEQLLITFGEGTANIGFGEMVDRGDGAYVYKDVANVNYSLSLTDVDCASLK